MSERLSLQRQIEILAECGIPLPDGADIDEIAGEWEPEAFESDPFQMLLVCIGRDEGDWRSDHVWHFDTECIEDNGAYVRIAERMRDLARGDLPLANVRDCVDIEEGVAWLAFELDGQAFRWNLEVENDWVDPSVFTKFVELLARRPTGGASPTWTWAGRTASSDANRRRRLPG